MQRVVSNTSPLIHLAKIGRLDLLKHLFNETIVPEAVYRESVVEGGNRKDAVKISEAEWIKVQKIKDDKLKRALMIDLDEGEAEAIVLALEEHADLIILDDYEGRIVARTLGLKVTGTIGILIKAKREGMIQSLKNEIDKLMRTGFWMNKKLYKRILEESGEV